MKTLNQLIRCTALSLILASGAFAGETQTPPCVPGEISTPPCAAAQANEPGEILTPPAATDEGYLTEIASSVLFSIMSLF
jgi:hypothetical protein